MLTLFNVVDVFGCAREEYLRSAERVSLTPFAFVKNGKWYERDDMTAFEVTDQKDVADWNKEFHEMFDSLDPDTLVSLYDCHI